MNRKIKELLFERIKEYQIASGCDIPLLDEDTKPYLEIEEFDSLRASELTAILSDELDLDFKKLKDVFLDNEEVTISELIDGIEELINNGFKKEHS